MLKCHGKPSKAHPDPHIGMVPHQGRHVALPSKEQYNARQGFEVFLKMWTLANLSR